MCQFVSWIEDEGNVLFLTTTDLKTKRGKAVWSRIKDDIIGHGAIREYYSKDGIPMEGGVNQECTNFSKPKNFPVEIQRALMNGAFIGMTRWMPERLLSGTLHEKYCADIARLYEKCYADIAILREKCLADKAPLYKKYNADRALLYKKYDADIATLSKRHWLLLKEPKNRSKAWREV